MNLALLHAFFTLIFRGFGEKQKNPGEGSLILRSVVRSFTFQKRTVCYQIFARNAKVFSLSFCASIERVKNSELFEA